MSSALELYQVWQKALIAAHHASNNPNHISFEGYRREGESLDELFSDD